MNMAREISELLEQIRLGEDSRFEFKRVELAQGRVRAPHADSLCQELAAFANARGGTLVLGVADDVADGMREVIGIPLEALDAVESWVLNLARDRIDPEPTLYTRRLEVPDRAGYMHPVLRIDIPPSLFVHKAPGGYFRRQGSARHEMGPAELQRLFEARARAGTLAYDEFPVIGCAPADLEPALYARLIGPSAEPEEIKLRKLKLLGRDADGNEWATVSGCLMATARPADWLRHAFVQCVHYAGDERLAQEQLDAQDIHGPLDAQVSGALAFVLRNMRIAARKREGRIDLPQYDADAVFEAVVNALAHRDYSIPGAPVQVHMFADRLEITSPGALPNSQSVDSIALRTATRNELLANLLARCALALDGLQRAGMMEKRGEGVPQIIARSLRLSGRRPLFALLGEHALRVTLYAADPATSPLLREMSLDGLRYPASGRAPDHD